jgi:Kef-type K+ transport system membrane component KefB/anti-sigma regulatory factor (Ser/Thr protein kinase)
MKKTLLTYTLLILTFGLGIALILHFGTALEKTVLKEIVVPVISTPEAIHHSIDEVLFKWLHHPLPLLLFQLIVIIFITRLFGFLVSFIAQPTVVGEILAGIVLGPSLLGLYFPDTFLVLFPKESLSNLNFFSQLGLIFFMFVVGMELDFDKIKRQSSASIFISHSSIIVPFFLGVGLAYILYPYYALSNITFTSFALFMGIAMSITAFPVLARIIKEKRLSDTRYGSMAITCAAADDITAWYILALIIAFSVSGTLSSSIILLFLIGLYILIMFYIVRPILAKIGQTQKDFLSMNTMSAIIILLLLSALMTEALGIHPLFGAFMAGVMMPSSTSSRLKELIAPRLEYVSLLVLLPLFFALTGLRTEIGLLNNSEAWLVCGAIIIVAVLGKLFGSAFAAKYMGFNWKDSLSLGILMNTRGLMELVALNIGYEMGILSTELFTMFVIMALVTTMMTGPMLQWVTRRPKILIQFEMVQKSVIDLLSHELRTPLTLIKGAATHLANRTMREDEKEIMVQTIVEGSRRMEKVIDNLLVHARFREGRTPLQTTLCRFEEIVFSALHISESDWNTKAKISNDTPLLSIMADLTLLELAVGNLLDNAFKYGHSVTINLSSNEGWNELRIYNDGTIPSLETLTQLGTQKGRLDNVSDKHGSGIGLYVCKSIVDAHEGELLFSIENNLFCVTLRLKGET